MTADGTSACGSADSASVSTPYLDRKLPLPGTNPAYRRIQPWQTALILLAFAFVVPLAIYLLFLSVILVHEVGHCVAAALVGMEFDGIRVGPIELNRNHKVEWHWNGKSFATGFARSLPGSESFLAARMAAEIIAGPLSNLMSAFLILCLYPDGDSLLFGLSQLFAIASLIVGLANLIPSHFSGTPSDGMRLLILLSSKRRKRWMFLLNRASALRRGATPEIETAMTLSSIGGLTSDNVETNWVAHTAALASRNHELAANYLEVCLANCSITNPDFREELILAAARFQAMRRNRVDLARDWLASGDPNKSKINRACTEAIVLFCEGRRDQALAQIEEGERLVAQMPDSPSRNKQEKAWQQLRALFMAAPDSCKNG